MNSNCSIVKVTEQLKVMNTAAIICEFNPFHTGHQYLIRMVKEQLGFDRVVCFMSGNFVQRGEPAVMDKYLRARDALSAGADLVLELPVIFSASAAGWFAHAAVSMILKSGICTHLIFGLEPGVSLEELKKEAATPIDPELLQEKLRQGIRYADAIYELRHYDRSEAKRGSNALLALSYLEALQDLDPEGKLIPVGITRIGDAYGLGVSENTSFTCATAIRNMLKNGNNEVMHYLPYSHTDAVLCFPDSMSMLLNEKLLSCDDFTVFWDVPLSLSEHLRKTKYKNFTFSERIDDCLHSCYSKSRISRALLHIMLGIKTEQAEKLKNSGYVTSCRALAYRDSTGLLHEIKEYGKLFVYTKNARFYEAEPDALYYDQIWHILTNTPSDFFQSPVIT